MRRFLKASHPPQNKITIQFLIQRYLQVYDPELDSDGSKERGILFLVL